MKLKPALLYLVALLSLDVASKQAAIGWIPYIEWSEPYPFGGIPLFSFGISCSLNTVLNSGAAWGVFSGHSGLLFMIRFFVIGVLISYLIYRRDWRGSVWIIVVGALGNVIDYCLYGFVVDFIHFNFWGWSFPIFNFADSYITIGAIWLFLSPKFYANPHLQSQK